MAVSKDEVLDAIAKMSVIEVVQLIADMEKKFGVTAAAPVAMAAGPAAGAAAAAPVSISSSAPRAPSTWPAKPPAAPSCNSAQSPHPQEKWKSSSAPAGPASCCMRP